MPMKLMKMLNQFDVRKTNEHFTDKNINNDEEKMNSSMKKKHT